MLKSFDDTKSPGTEIVIYVADEDPQLKQYIKILEGRHFMVGRRRYLVEIFNYISCSLYSDVDYYGEVNDDHIYRTKDWDNILINTIKEKGKGWGIACGSDLINNDWYRFRHPSACIISGNIIRALGYFVYPKLMHLYTDVFLRDIGEGIDSLFYVPEVIIEHMHGNVGKADLDENYKWIYSNEHHTISRQIYLEWCEQQRLIDINKIIKAKQKEAIPDGKSSN
jgi:hypothetical protein